MNISNNLFSLLFRLSQLFDIKKMIELFVESMNDGFKPAGFCFIEKSENEAGVEIEISAQNSSYGYIRIEQPTPLVKENFMPISNAVKILAVFLERAELEAKFKDALLTGEKTVNEKILQHQEIVRELTTARNDLSKLVENLKEEIKNKVQEELAHSYDLMKYAIEHSNGAVAVHDNELRYIYVSERYMDDFKVKDYNIIGKHHYEVFPDLPQKWRDIHQRVLNGEVCSSECDPYPHNDGTLEWTRWECRPWFNVDETIGGLIVYTEVITNQVLAENALRESESRFRLLAETAPFGIVISDKNQNTLFINQQFTHIFGYTIAEIPSVEEWWTLAYPDKVWRDQIRNEADKAVSKTKQGNEELQPVEYPVRCKDGSIKIIEFRLAITDELYFIVFIDITQRKRAEDELMQLKNHLEQQVQEKTVELQLQIAELERFHDATIEREFRIKELRDELKILKGSVPK